jgi:CBS-domain-containing membrane protein
LGRLQQQAGAAADIMSQPVITVKTTDRLQKAMSRMIDHDLKRLPVVDEDGRLAGWVSRVDVLRTIEYHQPVAEAGSEMPTQGHTVPQLMIRDVPTVSPQAALEEILQALEVNRSRRAVVIDEKQCVLGIITDGDLLRRSQRARHPNLLQRLRGLITGQVSSSPVHLPEAEETAADLMTAPVITVTPDTPIAEVLSSGILCVPWRISESMTD